MSEVNSINEILEFAIAREVEAHQFYTYMASRAKNAEMAQVCEDFAKEELEHKAKLELEVMKRGEVVHELNVSDYMMDVGDEMDMDYQELLLFAIRKEQISIDLYNDLAAVVKGEESREALSALVEEESEHKRRFEVEYDNLLKTG